MLSTCSMLELVLSCEGVSEVKMSKQFQMSF
jgi:hypothetical protein